MWHEMEESETQALVPHVVTPTRTVGSNKVDPKLRPVMVREVLTATVGECDGGVTESVCGTS